MTLFRHVRSKGLVTGAAALTAAFLVARGLVGGAVAPEAELATQSVAENPQVYEVRVYRINPGMMEEFVRFMGETLVPYEERMGMQILGHFVAEEENTYIWIRTFQDMATQTRVSDEMHATEEWKQEIVPHVGQYIDEIEVFFTTPTYYSKAQ